MTRAAEEVLALSMALASRRHTGVMQPTADIHTYRDLHRGGNADGTTKEHDNEKHQEKHDGHHARLRILRRD